MADEAQGAWRVLTHDGTTHKATLKRWERLGHVFYGARFPDWWDQGVGETEREAVEGLATRRNLHHAEILGPGEPSRAALLAELERLRADAARWRECECCGEGCGRCMGMGTLPPRRVGEAPPSSETTDTDAPQLQALGEHLQPKEPVACARCGVRHPWTPERGWGCPRAVAPQDTLTGLAGRLRDSQTAAIVQAVRARVAEREGLVATDALHARLAALETAFRAALALDEPYPLHDVLRILADAADHMLNVHSCDADGYETVIASRDAAREILRRLEASGGGRG